MTLFLVWENLENAEKIQEGTVPNTEGIFRLSQSSLAASGQKEMDKGEKSKGSDAQERWQKECASLHAEQEAATGQDPADPWVKGI